MNRAETFKLLVLFFPFALYGFTMSLVIFRLISKVVYFLRLRLPLGFFVHPCCHIADKWKPKKTQDLPYSGEYKM